MKKILLILGALIIAIGGWLYYTISNLDINGIVKSQIETQGKKATGRKVSVGSVDISLKNGNGNINKISLYNPSGSKYKTAINIDKINLNINIASITKTPKVINNISASGINAFVYLKNNGSFDIQVLQQSIANRLKKKKPQPQNTNNTKSKAESKNYDPNIMVKKISLKNIKLVLDLTKLNEKVYNVTLQSVNINNVGGKNGLPASQIGGVIVNELISQIVSNAKHRYRKILEQKAKEKLKKELERNSKKLLKKLF